MSDQMQPPPANDQGQLRPDGQLPLFYSKPEPMDPSRFGNHGLVESKFTAAFSQETHAVPIAITEFHLVQKHYPIVFAAGDVPMPLAALGLNRGENLFVQPDGKWAEDTYVPAYVRRYPFVLADIEADQRLVLCLETTASMITDQNPDIRFFDNGQPTDVTKQALELCKRFHEDLQLTRTVCEELKKRDLFKETELSYTAPSGEKSIAGRFVSIDTDKFDQMADADFLELRKRNFLPAVYLQSTSQTNWSRLAWRKQQQAQVQAPETLV